MKKLLVRLSSIILTLFLTSTLFSQSIGQGELMFVNQTGNRLINISIYPVGAIFSGGNQYTIDARYRVDGLPDSKYLWGRQFELDYYPNDYYYMKANFDRTSDIYDCKFSVGYGAYAVDIYDGIGSRSFFIDFNDANYCDPNISNYFHKIRIDCYDCNNVKFNFIDDNGNNFNQVNIDESGIIRVWEQKGTPNENNPFTLSKGNFHDTATYRDFPIDATEYGGFSHCDPNDVYLNLKVINTDGYIKDNSSMTFNNCIFTIDDGITFTINNGSDFVKITGNGGKLKTGIYSVLKLPHYFTFFIQEQACVDANYSIFQSNNSGNDL